MFMRQKRTRPTAAIRVRKINGGFARIATFVEMHKSFRMGDIVLARVMSIGDALFYYLTTAENMLGVVVALSASEVPMVPVSWTTMQCPVSSVRESRKIAKLAPIS
ncbi:exosome complex component CSL4 [Ixodes scapularis]